MKISDQYERFTDRGGAGAVGVSPLAPAKGVSETAPTARARERAGEVRRTEPGVLSVSVSSRAANLSTSAARLDELRSSIREGTFKIDARAIARALIGEEQA